MKHFPRLVVVLLTVVIPLANAAGQDKSDQVQLALKLRDGSLILGKTKDEELPVAGEAVGTVKIPLSRIATIKLGGEGKTDLVTFSNGDKLKGDVRFSRMTLETLFGRVSVAKELMAELQVRSGAGGAQAVEWELLPFPKNSDWPGDRGQPAEIGGDGTIVLHGQPVLSKQTFSTPVTIECDVNAPEPSEEDGGFALAAYAPDQATDMNPREYVSFNFGYRNRGEMRGTLSCQRIKTGSHGRNIWGERRTEFTPGKTYHLRLTFTADTSDVEWDGHHYDLEGVAVPYEKFKLHLGGWRTTDAWRISNFSVH